MKQFGGFPARLEFTPVPNVFINTLLAEMSDPAEVKTVLHIFRILYRKKGYPRFVSYGELLNDIALRSCLQGEREAPAETLQKALETASRRGILLQLNLNRENAATEGIYFLNTARDRETIARIQRGELQLPGLSFTPQATEMSAEPPPNIYTLYEQNIGLLTPLVAEQLKEAEQTYPETWIRDAIAAAVKANKRSWRYIEAILERWTTEGRQDGAHQRVPQKTDPDKFIKGRYGHMVKR